MSSFRSRESRKSGAFDEDRFLDPDDFRRVVFGFDLARELRFVERDLLVRREVEIFFFATKDPSQTQSKSTCKIRAKT
jgi:hypothetical protein